MRKGSNIFSEIKKFFKKDDADIAVFSLSKKFEGLKLSEKVLFGKTSRFNCEYPLMWVLAMLISYPCFLLKNPYQYMKSQIRQFMGAARGTFYNFINEDNFDWRKILYVITLKLWRDITVRSDHKKQTTCLIFDDTDLPKTGKRLELIGKIFSHVQHKLILGYKSLYMCISDGKSLMAVDFAIVGEKGKNGDHNMREKDRKRRYSREHDKDAHISTRIEEYTRSKMDIMKEMIDRAIRHKLKFDYVLADSWFACAGIIKHILSKHIKCHYLGMIKMGNTKYRVGKEDLSAKDIVRKHSGAKKTKFSRKLKCFYITIDCCLDGMPVRLFFVRKTKHGDWNGLITTDRSLEFLRAYEIYSMRWSIEVFNKESKQCLGLGDCQSRNFSAQIAHTTICAIQYNLLSSVRRFNSYESLGGLFNQIKAETMEFTIAEKIWQLILDMAQIINDVFEISDEEIIKAFIYKSDKMAQLHGLLECRQAG